MTTTRLWIAADHHAAFRCGGWAWLREAGGELAGQAGGARNTTAEANALAGLAAALKGLPAGEAAIFLSDQNLSRSLAVLVAEGAPASLVVAATPRTPMAFAAAWADLARDRAKAQGPFASAIPRPNLAKVQGL